MDYTGVLKRAWEITWKYKILWLFGLFVGGSSSGGGSGSRVSGSGGDNVGAGQLQGLENWAAENVVLIAVAVGLLVFIGIIWWVISLAAGPGLVHLVKEADEGRPVRGGDGWATGFHYWGRNFAIGLVLYLPIIVVGLVLVGMLFVTLIPVFEAGDSAAGGGLVGLCCGGGLLTLVLIVASVLAGVLYVLALRFAVLADRGVFDAIRDAWQTVRTRFKDVAVMWLLVLVVGMAFGIVTGLIAVIIALPAVFLFMAESYVAAALVIGGLILLLMFPGAIFGAFNSAIWTVFFRRLQAPAPAVTAAPAGSYSTYLPPPPPAAPPQPPAQQPPYQPPAPPTPYAEPGAPPPPAPPEPPEPPAQG